jgi:hypothetical protein
MPVKFKGKTHMIPFCVVDKMEHSLIGINGLQMLDLSYDAKAKEIFTIDHHTNLVSLLSDVTIPAHQTRIIKGRFHGLAESFATQIVTIQNSSHPTLIGGPGITQIDEDGRCTISLTNAGPVDLALGRGDIVGCIDQIPAGQQVLEINSDNLDHFLYALTNNTQKDKTMSHEEIRRRVHLDVPEEYRDKYLQLLYRYKKVISISKADLGRSRTYHHRIHLKDPRPVYQPQFPLKPDHQAFIENTLEDWLKLGVVRKTKSLYNSPIFCVPKKNGQGLRIVQDFRGLNAKTKMDKYSMKEISECISDIGRAGSKIFTTIDLTSGFWQMPIDERDSHLTAFTVKNKGQFEWITSPMGLLGCPASFQRLMERVMDGIKNVLIYIDDVIIHTQDHDLHLQVLEQTLQRIQHHGLKINLDKCYFGNKEVAYLGFTLTPNGILPGKDKIKALADFETPQNLKEVRAFVGLCNFFRNHIKDFAMISTPLTRLTCKDSGYSGGPLPEDATRSFHLLKNLLTSEPCLAFPREDRSYALVTEAYMPNGPAKGGIGAALCQFDDQGRCYVLSYSSRQLLTHETNYPPDLIELLAACEAMEHFDQVLRGRQFVLFMDQRTPSELSHLHKKTLARFKIAMEKYSFVVQSKAGSPLPAHLRSASPARPKVVSPMQPVLIQNQLTDPDILDCLYFQQYKRYPEACEETRRRRLGTVEGKVFKDHQGTVWIQFPQQTALFLPQLFRKALLCQQANDRAVSPVELTQRIIAKGNAWPGMTEDIQIHLDTCTKCVNPATADVIQPNQTVAVEIFGPFPSYQDAQFIVTMMDLNTGMTEFVPVANKTPVSIAQAIFADWCCKYTVPNQITTLMDEKTNDAIKSHILEYLDRQESFIIRSVQGTSLPEDLYQATSNLLQEAGESWEDYIPALQFAYNTSYSSKLQAIPFQRLFGRNPRTFTDLEPSYADDLPHHRLNIFLHTQRTLEKFRQQKAAESKPNVDNFEVGQAIYFWENSFMGKNFQGPFEIIQVAPNKVRIQLTPKKTRWVPNNRVCFEEDISKQGEDASGSGSARSDRPKRARQNLTDPDQLRNFLEQKTQQAQQLIGFQADQSKALQALANQLLHQANQAKPEINCVINAIEEDPSQLREYLRRTAIKLYSSSLPAHQALTPQELSTWKKFSPSDINWILTGDPTSPPEWRTGLMDFPEETWTAEAEPEAPDTPAAPDPVQESQWIAPIPEVETSGPQLLPSDAKPSKGPKGFIRGFQDMSRRVRKATSKAVTKIKGKSDQNNNRGDGQARFYVDLGLEEFQVADISTTC